MTHQSTGCKKLINSPDTCVDDDLEGYVALNPGVRLLQGHRVVVRADFEELQRKGKVAVVSGGGSGHDPAFVGYVAPGMLAACAMGEVFTSPPPSEVLAAVRAVAKNNPAGCVLVIPNYTGDRLNFGMAAHLAHAQGIKLVTCVIGEDCAVTSADKTSGRRGLTGVIISIKIAGALAEEGRSAQEIVEMVNKALHNMATIGVGLTPAFVPGSGPTFSLPDDKMELGLGVHGEAGVQRMEVTTAKQTVKIMLDHMTNHENINHLRLQKGERVAIFINDLGGLSLMDLNIVAKEAIQYLESREVRVLRALSAPFMTSLEMAGVHVTVLRLDNDVTRCLDAPTESPYWPRCLMPVGVTDRYSPAPLKLDYLEVEPQKDMKTSVNLSEDEGRRMQAILTAACQALIQMESNLNSLDRGAGDGDCGTTLARGARGVLSGLSMTASAGLPVNSPGPLALRLAQIAHDTMGGASGGLYGLLFTGASSSLNQELRPNVWTEALREGIAMMMKYGGAEAGDRTMLDALQPALDALTSTTDNQQSTVSRFQQAALAAEKGAESTRQMKPRAGRASYVSASLVHEPDPGAVGVATWLRAACNAFAEQG